MMKRFVILLICLAAMAWAGQVRVDIGLDSQDGVVGEALTFQVKVSNADNVETPPDLPSTEEYDVRASAPSRNSSSQISIVNGHFNKTVINEILYNFQIIPKKTGALVIPQIMVKADGKNFKTRPVTLRISKAEEITDISLELELSSGVCYVGQPLMAHWHWYIGRNVSGFAFDLPFRTMTQFQFPVYEPKVDQKLANNYRKVPFGDGTATIGLLKNVVKDGNQILCLDFSFPVIPKETGIFEIPAGSVQCEVPDTRAQRRRRDPFFDDFFGGTPTKTVRIEGNTVRLEVRELPAEGRPDNFSGIVGKCRLSAEAKPLEVNVGDPIVFQLHLLDLTYPEVAHIPAFSTQKALNGKFRISDEDSGTVQNGIRTFQATFRALNEDVTEIPPMEIAYFDAEHGKYETVRSEAIPLTVHAVKTVTASDAQGFTALEPEGGAEVKSFEGGIAHNALWEETLAEGRAGFRTWGSTLWKPLLAGIFAGIYLCLAVLKAWLCHRNANPRLLAARQEAARAMAQLAGKGLGADGLSSALQDFLRARLMLSPGTLTFADVATRLRKSLDAAELTSMETLFRRLEEARYAGASASLSDEQETALKLARLIDKKEGWR